MSSKLSVNVKYPEIVVPDTDVPGGDTPDTGMFSVSHNDMVNNTNNMVVPIIGISIVVLVLVALVINVLKNHKQKKSNKFSIHTGKGALLRFTGLFALILVATFAFVQYNEKQENNVNATRTNTNTNTELSITTEDININVTLDDTPVFATTKSTVTVDAATTNGYTLMAYVDSNTSDLTNETNTNATTKITGLESSYSQPLTENTWGVALSLPESQDAPVFRGLPTNKEDAMMIKVTGSTATNANDTTELYYATYVTPDLEEGTYTGATVNYVAVSNPTTNDDIIIRFYDFNDFLFNTVTYGLDCSIVYIGGNCRKAYVGGTTITTGADGTIGNVLFKGDTYEVSLVPIVYSEADAVRIVSSLPDDGWGGMVVVKGIYQDVASLAARVEEIEAAGGNPYDMVVYSLDSDVLEYGASTEVDLSGDAFTIISVPVFDMGYDDLIYNVTPIYADKPSDINTTETTICSLMEGNEEGGKIYDLPGEDIYSFGSRRSVTIPGADGLRAEITYNFPSEGVELYIYEGGSSYYGLTSEIPKYYSIMAYNSDISGTRFIDFDGDMIVFDFGGSYPYNEENNYDFGYGFSAKIYPLYNNETSDTIPDQTCKITEKNGAYNSAAPDNICYSWVLDKSSYYDGMISSHLGFEYDFESWLYLNYDLFRGKTLNISAQLCDEVV